nr:unnamed protein product [Digitaria exilis]
MAENAQPGTRGQNHREAKLVRPATHGAPNAAERVEDVPRRPRPRRAPGVGQAAGPAVEVDERVHEAASEGQAEAQDPRVQDTACPRRVRPVRTCVERVAGVALSCERREEVGVVGSRVGIASRAGGAREGGAEGRALGSRLGRGAEERCGGGTHVRTAAGRRMCRSVPSGFCTRARARGTG